MITRDQVETFVGIDIHSEDCALTARDRQGDIIRKLEKIPTTVRLLRKAVKGLPSPVWVMLEASTMAFFAKECLDPVVDNIIVSEPHDNFLVWRGETKNDIVDSDSLSYLLRLNSYRAVHIPKRPRLEIRELVQAYQKTSRDTTRHKNRIRDKYRRYGVRDLDASIYSPDEREVWLTKVKRATLKDILAAYYSQLDSAVKAQMFLQKRLHDILHRTREYKVLRTIPGIGPVLAAMIIGAIDTPFRFATKQKLWTYAGLSVRSSTSGKQKQAKIGGSRRGNRLLKYAAMSAAKHAMRGSNAFSRHMNEMLNNGVEPAMVQKTIARKILATVWSMWKSKTMYQDNMQARAA